MQRPPEQYEVDRTSLVKVRIPDSQNLSADDYVNVMQAEVTDDDGLTPILSL